MLLVGDVGGTKTDLAVFSADLGPGAPIAQKRFPSGDFPSLEGLASEYVREVELPIANACFAVAGPVISGKASLTNLPWVVEETTLQTALNLDSVCLLNDVQAMAAAVPHLKSSQVRTLQEGEPVPSGVLAIVAVGTGLGEAFLTWDGSRYHAYASEGGHNNFGPTTPQQTDLLRFLQARWGRVSYERVCAGRSIPDLYDFLKGEDLIPETAALGLELANDRDRTPRIVAAALDPREPDRLSLAAVNMFVSILGTETGNLALTVLATGGVYIAGGMAQRILPVAEGARHTFLSTFRDKGRLSPFMSRVPLHIILEPVALLGAAVHGLELMHVAGV
jgi:glucokinase